ncbi:DUF6801 domain-containing protein [Flexivirga alba]|uniref:DUF6801 domain-containing protein n=1 Tax=Flexivirga alba TaxID=702742 RepID=A0ABW2ABK4_9MICO
MSRSTGHEQGASRRHGTQRVLGACGALGVAAGLTITGIAVSGPAHAATTTKLAYTCSAPAIGLTFSDPWSVSVQTDYPATAPAGASFTSTHFDASVTAGDDAATQFRALAVNSWSGSVKFSYAVSGAVASPGDRSSTLTVPTTTLPATGPVVTEAKGAAAPEHAGDKPGTATVTAGDFKASLTTDSGVPVEIDCTLAAGQDATVASVDVTAASPSSSTSPSSSPSSTSATTGPPIITDGGTSNGNDTGILIGAGVAAAGVAVLGAGAARRLRVGRK